MELHGKPVLINRHAYEGMNAESPPIRIADVRETLTNPDMIQGEKYLKWVGRRTIIIYVVEYEDWFEVKGASATRKKIIR